MKSESGIIGLEWLNGVGEGSAGKGRNTGRDE